MNDAIPDPASFLSAYFHEDWDLDAPTWRGVVKLFVRDYGDRREDVRALARALITTAASGDVSLIDLGCYYDPASDGMTSEEWLVAIATLLLDAR